MPLHQRARHLTILLAVAAMTAQAGPQPLEADIVAVQGSGLVSPLVGQSVRIGDGIVTAVFDGGLFLQMRDADADDPSALTSNGLRIQTSGWPQLDGGAAVEPGQRLAALGVVQEVGSETRLLAQSLQRRDALLHPLPLAVELSVASGMPRQRPDNLSCALGLSNFECLEGMRVALPEGVASGGSQAGEGSEFGSVFVSPLGQRSLREKGVRDAAALVEGNQLAGLWDGNPETLGMDPYRLGGLAGGMPLAGGARFAAIGVLAVEQGDYQLWPQWLQIAPASNSLPRPLPATAGVGGLRVASFDTGGLCDAQAGNTPQPCSLPEPTAAQRDVQVHRLADYVIVVLGAPAVLALQQVENLAVLEALSATLNARIAGADYRGQLHEGSDPRGLDQGFLVDEARVVVQSLQPLAQGQQGSDGRLLHPVPPLLLQGSQRLGDALGPSFRVLTLRLDDRAGVDADAPGVRQRRFDQAHSLAALVQALQHAPGSADAPLLVAGKFHGGNSTDGLVDVLGLVAGSYFNPENLLDVAPFNPVSPLLWDSVLQSPPEARVTALQSEDFGAIQGAAVRRVQVADAHDHLLLSLPAQQVATFAGIGGGNADAAVSLRDSGDDGVASSPFDGVVVDLDAGCRSDPQRNVDGDGWCNLRDNCPDILNDDQLDFDGDGEGDACDADRDGDGIDDNVDNCPLLPNADQGDGNGDGVGDVCDADADGDGIENVLDNCPLIANPGQEDFDADGLGDACDPQADMQLALQAQPASATPGGSLQLAVSVANLGPQAVQQPLLRLALPGGLSVAAQATAGWECSAVEGGVVCRRALLAPGSAELTFTLAVATGLLHGRVLEIGAVLAPDDLDPGNNRRMLALPVVVASTDLRLIVVGPSPALNVGDRVDLLATVNNLGLRDVEAAQLHASHAGASVLLAPVPDPAWTCSSPPAGGLACDRALPAGAQATLGYTLEVLPGAAGALLVELQLSSEVADPLADNNSAILRFVVGEQPSGIFADGFEAPAAARR